MKFRVVKTETLQSVAPGRRSDLSALLKKLMKLEKGESVLIETPHNQRQVYNRMRSNVFKWKLRKGLRGIEVHLTESGNVSLQRN